MREKRFSLCLGQQLRLNLEKQAHLDGRNLQGQVLYLLEVMVAVANRNPGLRLRPEPYEKTGHNLAIKLCLSEQLNDQTFHFAGSYGLTQQQLMRTFLWMGLDCCKQFCPNDQVLGKEELIQLVLGELAPARVQ